MTETIHVRTAAFEPASFNADHGTVDAIISTGADVPRRDLSGPFIERLSMAPDAWTTARPTVPVLKDHQRTVDSVIGRAENIRVENGRALATIRLSDRPDLAGIRRDIQTGILDSLSFGFTVPKWREYSENGTRVREAEQIVVHEVSFVPIGADPQATTRGEVTMEQQQQEQIRSIATAVGVPAAFAEDLIQRNVSVDDARVAIIREAAKNTPAIDNRQPAVVTRDAGDNLIARLADGLYSRMNSAHKPEAGREFAYARISDIARRILQERGLSTLGSPAELVTRALHTTSDFSAVLAEVYNKSLLALRSTPSAVEQLFRRATVADFRARHVMEISDGPALALRALDTHVPAVEDIGFVNGVWEDIVNLGHGLVLVTGATGAGKSTTIASKCLATFKSWPIAVRDWGSRGRSPTGGKSKMSPLAPEIPRSHGKRAPVPSGRRRSYVSGPSV